jgi:hypothetical protein
VILERRPHAGVLDSAAAQGDDRRGSANLSREGVQRGDDQPLLASPELPLPLALEEGGDRLAQLVREELVSVDHAEAEPLRHRLRGPGLAGRHETYEHDAMVRRHQTSGAIRCAPCRP